MYRARSPGPVPLRNLTRKRRQKGRQGSCPSPCPHKRSGCWQREQQRRGTRNCCCWSQGVCVCCFCFQVKHCVRAIFLSPIFPLQWRCGKYVKYVPRLFNATLLSKHQNTHIYAHNTRMGAHIHIHTYTHTHTQTQTHTYTRAHQHTSSYTCLITGY